MKGDTNNCYWWSACLLLTYLLTPHSTVLLEELPVLR